MSETMGTIQNKTRKSTIKKSAEDIEIESLDKKRKELRQKANKTLKDKVEYAELVEQQHGGKERSRYRKHQKQERAQDRSINIEINK